MFHDGGFLTSTGFTMSDSVSNLCLHNIFKDHQNQNRPLFNINGIIMSKSTAIL